MVRRQSELASLLRIGGMYFVQGLPVGFFSKQLPVQLRMQGYSLKQLGVLGFLGFPWFLKVFVAPYIDTHWSVRLGRRKSWIIPLQALLFVIMVLAGLVGSPLQLALLIVAMNFCTAFQDVAVDGLAIDTATPATLGWVNSVQIVGFKAGVMVGGGLLATACDALGLPFQFSFHAMAACVFLVLLFCVLPYAEPTAPAAPASAPVQHTSHGVKEGEDSSTSEGKRKSKDKSSGSNHEHDREIKAGGVWSSIATIARSCRQPEVLAMLVFVATYKTGEVMGDTMFKPFLVDRGIGAADIALWSGVYAMCCSMAGSMLGGRIADASAWVARVALLNLVPQVLRAALVLLPGAGPHVVVAVMCLEGFTGGLLTTCVFTWMMANASKDYSASHFTFFATVEATGKFLAQAASGLIAHHYGYGTMFAAGALCTAATTMLLFAKAPHHKHHPH
eukprot:m.163789 g.163789  ORF g.163789 m.163789 type:complete len:447 (+) comp15219_c0_seq1:182-1522(+)